MASVFAKLNFVEKFNKLGEKKATEEVKEVLSHVGLYIGLIVYTIAGAKIFQELESPNEKNALETHLALLITKREVFLETATNESTDNSNFRETLSSLLTDYESVISDCVGAGIDVVEQNYTVSWDFIQSVFFTTTILTTIGYGHIAPVTIPGRGFCMVYAIVGIPLCLSVLADIGQILATIISKMIEQYKMFVVPILKKYNMIAQKKKEAKENDEEKDQPEEEEEEEEEDEDEGGGMLGNIKTAVISLLVLSAVIATGAYFFSSCQDLTFFEGFYFCFISLTTIGFGDIVPDLDGDTLGIYMTMSTIYILVGMTVFTTIIEIVRQQYEESMRKMQELRAQIQAQIRLAETLRKMGEQGALDPEAAAELDKIKGKLAKYKGKMGKGFDDLAVDELEWMDNNKNVKAITIIFYETSL